jgi:hypothetical protein
MTSPLRALLLGAALATGQIAAPAIAGRPAASSPWADITNVQPELVAHRSDASGRWCEYRALVTLSWNGAQRLWVSQIVDGVRSAPGELSLTGTATNRTLLVSEIVAIEGHTAPLVAEAWVFSKRAPLLLDAQPSTTNVTCPAT